MLIHRPLRLLHAARAVLAGLLCSLLAPLVGAQALQGHGEPGGPMQAVPLAAGEAVRLDGRLDDAVWQRAPAYSAFVEIDPVRGRVPAEHRTRVQVAYGDRALYVAVVALDPRPEQIVRPLVRHDQVNRTQDFVVVYIDPVGSRQSAQFFRVNAAGSTADGLHTADNDNESFAPDYDFDAATGPWAKDGETGWVAEFRIPYASLRYSAGGQAAWRIQVGRRVPREQFTLLLSVPLQRQALSFIDAMQPLAGFVPPTEHGFLTLRPTLTARRTDEEPAGEPRRSASELRPSLDLKWRPRAELVVDATLNPDFSQVELDVPRLSRNTRFALFLTEKRPFFLESGDLLASPTDALYTRSVNDPQWGQRASWRGEGLAGTALVTRDRGGGLVLLPGPYGTGSAEQPANATLMSRVRGELGALSLGAIAIDRRYANGAGSNSVLGADGSWRLGETWRLKAQWLGSRSTALADASGALREGPAQQGSRWYANLHGRTERSETDLTLQRIDAGFRNDAGFLAQAGVRKAEFSQTLAWHQVGLFNKVELFVNAQRTEALGTGEMVAQSWFPGVYATAPGNTELNLEFDPASRLRTGPGAPVLSERYWHLWGTTSPARWMPLLEASLDRGDLADVSANRVRPGTRWYTLMRLRPLPSLELEPRVDQLVLRDGGQRLATETAARLLGVLHLAPRQSLRLILQHSSYERRPDALAGLPGERSRSSAQSLTYTWRQSAGSVLYVGASRGAVGLAPDRSRGGEVFVKLQVDIDEGREAWRARRGR